jgi:hypothetical protein
MSAPTKRLLLAFICILVPLPAFSYVVKFSVLPFVPQEGERKTDSVRAVQLFPSDTGNQSEPLSVPENQQTKANPAPKVHPHMIELTAANWRPLTNAEKFGLFSHDLLHWGTHASIAFDSGLSMATKDRPYLGNSARGYFTRYGLNVADEANFCFFTVSFFPAIFHQDPRYIPRDGGSTGARLSFALTRVIVTRGDSGQSEVNRSNIVGMFLSTSISSVMYSSYGADVGVGGNFVAFGYNIMTEAAFDVLKEFWPDVARKMKLNLWLRNIVRASLRDHVRVS